MTMDTELFKICWQIEFELHSNEFVQNAIIANSKEAEQILKDVAAEKGGFENLLVDWNIRDIISQEQLQVEKIILQKNNNLNTKKPASITSKVDHPKHYNPGTIEVIDAIEDWGLNFHTGNIVKYIVRYGTKNGIEDLKKAQWYLTRLIEIEERAAVSDTISQSQQED